MRSRSSQSIYRAICQGKRPSQTPSKRRLSRRFSRALTVLSLMAIPVATHWLPLPANDANAQTQVTPVLTERVISVTGQGQQRIPTTLTQVSLSVSVEASTAQSAQAQTAERQSRVVEWLRSQNVQRLETTGISLSPRYDYRNDTQQLRGYQATNTIQFRVPTDQAGDIIDRAVEVGATNINSISFVAEDSALEAARQQALEAAVANAQEQADTVLAALGLARQEVISITIGTVSAPPVFARAQAADRSVAFEESTPIIGQSQTVEGQVTLHIRY